MKTICRTYELAKRWDCSQRTIRRLLDAGKLPGFKAGGTWRIKDESVEKIKKNHSRQLTSRYGIESSKSKDDLVDLMGEVGETFDYQRINRLRGPIVYAWIRSGKCLYIGRSYNGIARPLDTKHHQIGNGDFLPEDEILIWPVANKRACDRIERDLIDKLMPALNRKCSYVESQEIA